MTRERVEQKILACFGDGYEPDAGEVAMALVDEDVSRGDYEGCSSDLEIAYTEYEQAAARLLAPPARRSETILSGDDSAGTPGHNRKAATR